MNLQKVNLQKLNPWNWFKHEEEAGAGGSIPVRQGGTYPTALGANYSPLADFHREIDRIFDNALRGFGFSANPTASAANGGFFRPLVDISGDENSYEIRLDVPGMAQEDLSIDVRGDSLVVRGEKHESHESQEKAYYRVERSYGSFQRTLALPDDANADEINATLKDGVLSLSIPRRQLENKKAKRIAIN
jgi:HSP20 family protein